MLLCGKINHFYYMSGDLIVLILTQVVKIKVVKQQELLNSHKQLMLPYLIILLPEQYFLNIAISGIKQVQQAYKIQQILAGPAVPVLITLLMKNSGVLQQVPDKTTQVPEL